MRAGEWLRFRDIHAGRLSWQRASQVADRMPQRSAAESMRIAPRALLCATAFRIGHPPSTKQAFEETSRLADAAGDKISLAMAMSGRMFTLTFRGRLSRVRLEWPSELVALIDVRG